MQPGLNEEIERVEKKYINNVADLKAKHKEFKLKLPWVETLDLVTAVAPMAPDVALQLQETAQRRKWVNNIILDPLVILFLSVPTKENSRVLFKFTLCTGSGRPRPIVIV